MSQKKWIVETKRADFRAIGETFGIDPLIARLIRNRGPVTEEEVRVYLYGGKNDLHNGMLLADMEEACRAIEEHMARRDRIRIVGDYDVDGVSATYILLKGLGRIGADCDWDIPERVRDGYGINERIIDRAAEDGVGLVVTCDNGISAKDTLAHAAELGMEVVVTDHHEIPQEEGHDVLPEVRAVVNPHRADSIYPFRGLCGAAVAYKLVEALYRRAGIASEELDPLLEFAALATVADVMDLEGENRIIVREGLKLMKHSANPGLSCLMDENGVDREHITAFTLGFVIGPCINAAGRLETAARAMELLLAEDRQSAVDPAVHLRELNEARKSMTSDGVAAAIEAIECGLLGENGALIDGGPSSADRVLVVCLPECHESLAGIVAGKIKERYYRPAFVLTRGETADGQPCLKGSGRSIEAYSMYEKLCEVRDLLLKFGGHPMAAGLSLPEAELPEFRRRLNETCGLNDEDLTETVRVDLAVPPAYLTAELVEQISLLEPFGNGNAEPLFAEAHLRICSLSVVGKHANVVKMKVKDDRGNIFDAVRFRDADAFLAFLRETWGDDEVLKAMRGAQNRIDIAFAYRPQINAWRGRRNVELVVEDYCRIAR